MRTATLNFVKNVGLLCSVTGQVCSLVILCFPHWLTFSSGIEKCMLGVWEMFVTRDLGRSMCRASTKLWNLAAEMMVIRILMCIVCGSGALGIVAVLVGLACKKFGGRRASSLDRITNVSGGSLLFLAGVIMLVAMSYIGHITAKTPRGREFPNNAARWERNSAVVCGWIGAFFLLTGGLLLLVAQVYANVLAEKYDRFYFKPRLFKKRVFV